MAALEEKLKDKKRQNEQTEVIAGISRRQFNLILGGGIAIVVIILIVGIVVIIGNNNRIAAENATATAVSAAVTGTSAALAAQQATASQAAADFSATQTALVPTPVQVTPTARIAVLPPTWTPTPSHTPITTPTALPAPLGLNGRLVVWSGRDELNTGYLPIGYYDLSFGNQYRRIGQSFGKYASISPNGQRVLYERYDNLVFSSVIEAINLNGSDATNIADFYVRQGLTIVQPRQPAFGAFAQRVAFVARTDRRSTFQVFVVEIGSMPPGVQRVRQLTDDDSDYSFPAFSPDGTSLAVVRTDLNAAIPRIDIVRIDVATGGKSLISNDLDANRETHPRWTRDGRQIVYAVAPATDPNNHDIFLRNADGTGSPLPLFRDDSDVIYPILSPDERYLAFASNRAGNYNIFIYDRVTQDLMQLTSDSTDDFPGGWWQS